MELWLMGLSGWVLYNLILLQKNAKIIDLNQDGVLQWKEVKKHLGKDALSIIITLVITLIMVGFHLTEEAFFAVCEWQEWDLTFYKFYHLTPAAFSIAIQAIITKLTK